MQRAAECWRTLTPEQRGDFIQKVQKALGIAGGKQRGSGPRAPAYKRGVSRYENYENTKPAMGDNKGNAFDEENRQDARPAASKDNFRLVSPPHNPKPATNGGDVPNAPNDQSVPFSPFDYFGHYCPTGKYL